MKRKTKVQNKLLEKVGDFFSNRFIKIALILLFAGLFLGYSMRYLDFVKRPILNDVGVIYPIHEQYQNHYYPMTRGYAVADQKMAMESDASLGPENIGESPIDLLYVMRNNIISSLILIATGVLIGIPSIIYLFVIGMSAGASLPEVLEFAPFGTGVEVIFLLFFYSLTVVLATSIGIELGKIVLDFIRGREIKIDKTIYDRAIYVVALVVVNIVLQYLLLVI